MHVDSRILQGGGLRGSLPNALVRGEEVQLTIARQVFGPKVVPSKSGGGGGGGSLTVSDGTTTVTGVTTIGVTGGTVSSPTAGEADITISGGGSGATPPAGIGENLAYWWAADLTDVAQGTDIAVLQNFAPTAAAMSAFPVFSGAGVLRSATNQNSKAVFVFPGSGRSQYQFPQGGPFLGQCTVFFVLDASATGSVQSLISGSNSDCVEIDIDATGHLALVAAPSTNIATSTGTITGGWIHGNVKWDSVAGGYSIRIVGAPDSSGSVTHTINERSDYIGGAASGATLLTGAHLAELIIYNRALSGGEILNIENYLITKWALGGGGSVYDGLVIGNSPVGYWKMDENSGTSANDSGPNAFPPGTYASGVTIGQASLGTGLGDSALMTGAANTYLDIPHDPLMEFTSTDFSIECWVALNSNTGNQQFLCYFDGGNGWRLLILGGPFRFFIGSSNPVNSSTVPPSHIGTTYHVVVTFNSSTGTYKMYVNGALENTSSTGQAGPSATSGSDLFIGNLAPSIANVPWVGPISNVAIYANELSSGDIAAHYAAGA